MRSLRIEKYNPNDYLDIDVHGGEVEAREDQPVQYFARYHNIGGPAMTVKDALNTVVACGGVTLLWPGTGEAWLVVCRQVKQYIGLLRVCRIGLEIVKKNHNLKRIQAVIDPRREEAVRFVTHLGFEFEALMKQYGPKGVDKCMYALTED